MAPRVARRPVVRWLAVGFVFALVLLWYTGAPSSVSTPRWGPKTPLAHPGAGLDKSTPPINNLSPALEPHRPDVKPPGDTTEKEAAPTIPDPKGQQLGSNDFDFLDSHPDLIVNDPVTRTTEGAAISPTASASSKLLSASAPHESTMHAPHSGSASATAKHAPQKTGASADSKPGEASTKSTMTADDYLEHFKSLMDVSSLTVGDAKKSCEWPTPEDVNFQYGTDKEWVKNDRPTSEIAQHRKEWQDFVKNDMIPYKNVSHKFEGRGIIVCAGNERSMLRLQVLLRMLRHFETKLPVEVHYFGDEELSVQNRTDLQGLFPNLYFNNLNGPDAVIKTKHANFVINYSVKLASMLNSRFAEPMLLDSDNVPVSDPISLFESDTYRTFGSVFYPDIARTRPENPMWAITNTECRPDEYEMESGQMAVDKRRFWYHLQLAAFFGHKDYYQEFLLGDKDCFRFAWHALKTPYGRPARWITSVGFVARPRKYPVWPETVALEAGASEKPDDKFNGGANSFYCGHSFGQHHPDGVDAPILFLHGGLIKTLNQEQIIYAKEHGRGLFGAYKNSVKANAVRLSTFISRAHTTDTGAD